MEEKKQSFYMEALRVFQSCLQRQVNEAVRISSSKADLVMNSKSEFHQAPIVRVTVAAGLQLGQGEEQEVVARGRGGRGAGSRRPGTSRGAGRARRQGNRLPGS